jgi:hypothetical protein
VPGGIDDEQSRDLELESAVLVDNGCLLLDSFDWEVGSSDLLSDTASFTFLNVGLPNLVKKFGLASIDVSQNTADGRTQVVLGPSCQGSLVLLLAPLSSFLLPLCLCLSCLRSWFVIRIILAV